MDRPGIQASLTVTVQYAPWNSKAEFLIIRLSPGIYRDATLSGESRLSLSFHRRQTALDAANVSVNAPRVSHSHLFVFTWKELLRIGLESQKNMVVRNNTETSQPHAYV
jgi:hypothetical protein